MWLARFERTNPLMFAESKSHLFAAWFHPVSAGRTLAGPAVRRRAFETHRGPHAPWRDGPIQDRARPKRVLCVRSGNTGHRDGGPVNPHLMWVDRTGKTSDVGSRSLVALNPRLYSDGRRVAFYVGATPDLDYDFDRYQPTRLTTDPADDRFPLFSHDESRLVFASNRDNPTMAGLYEKSSNGTVAEPTFCQQNLATSCFRATGLRTESSSSSRRVVGLALDATSGFCLCPLTREASGYATSPANKRDAALSPDGRWLAYVSNETGSYQVIVQAFPNASRGKTTISRGGRYLVGRVIAENSIIWIQTAGSSLPR